MTTIEEKIQEAATGEKTIQAEKEADTFTLNKKDSELLENIWKNNSRSGISENWRKIQIWNFIFQVSVRFFSDFHG